MIVESPTYDRTLLNLRNRGADVRMVDLETDGISIEGARDGARRRACTRSSRTSSRTSRTRPATRSPRPSARLLELAVEHDFTIFEDDPYVAIRFEGEAMPTMFSQDDAGRVVYASSFSKTVCPGIRVGYLVGPQAVIKQIQTIATNTYISPNMVAQSIVNQFAAPAAWTARSRRSRRRCARAATRWSPRSSARSRRRRSPPPQGGYFMWVELPEAVDVAELEKAAAEREVLFVKGTDFLLEGGRTRCAWPTRA